MRTGQSRLAFWLGSGLGLGSGIGYATLPTPRQHKKRRVDRLRRLDCGLIASPQRLRQRLCRPSDFEVSSDISASDVTAGCTLLAAGFSSESLALQRLGFGLGLGSESLALQGLGLGLGSESLALQPEQGEIPALTRH
jgi:hypothetical protein